MEKQYKDIPNGNPSFGEFYCPWCATKQRTHLNVFTVFCSGCGRELIHNGTKQKVPEAQELKACSDSQLYWMLRQFCVPTGNTTFVQKIVQAVPDRPAIVFAAAEILYNNPATRDLGWNMLLELAQKNHYDALATIYNAYFSEDFKYQGQLKKYSEILVREFGDHTAADTLRTILKKEGRL